MHVTFTTEETNLTQKTTCKFNKTATRFPPNILLVLFIYYFFSNSTIKTFGKFNETTPPVSWKCYYLSSPPPLPSRFFNSSSSSFPFFRLLILHPVSSPVGWVGEGRVFLLLWAATAGTAHAPVHKPAGRRAPVNCSYHEIMRSWFGVGGGGGYEPCMKVWGDVCRESTATMQLNKSEPTVITKCLAK